MISFSTECPLGNILFKYEWTWVVLLEDGLTFFRTSYQYTFENLALNWTTHFCFAGRDEWKLIAEKLGFNQDQIRFLDKRSKNPAEEFLGCIASERYLSVGDLYSLLRECGVPVIADYL